VTALLPARGWWACMAQRAPDARNDGVGRRPIMPTYKLYIHYLYIYKFINK
jgi:hypothetical protein